MFRVNEFKIDVEHDDQFCVITYVKDTEDTLNKEYLHLEFVASYNLSRKSSSPLIKLFKSVFEEWGDDYRRIVTIEKNGDYFIKKTKKIKFLEDGPKVVEEQYEGKEIQNEVYNMLKNSFSIS